MTTSKKTLHVNPVGANWEVESESSTLGQAETKPEAIELAKELAVDEAAEEISVHTADGTEEQRIEAKKPTPSES